MPLPSTTPLRHQHRSLTLTNSCTAQVCTKESQDHNMRPWKAPSLEQPSSPPHDVAAVLRCQPAQQGHCSPPCPASQPPSSGCPQPSLGHTHLIVNLPIAICIRLPDHLIHLHPAAAVAAAAPHAHT